jgi:hypothetical protein
MQKSEQGDVLFHETQWYQPRWLWVLVLGTAGAVWYWAIHRHWNDHFVADFIFAFWWAALGLLGPAFLLSYRQITEVRVDGIYVKRSPFSRAADVIRFSQFYRYQPRVCSPIYSAGGWGIGQGWQGKAYNMGGSHGLELCLVGGGRVLIGSCKMRQLLDALHSQCRGRVYSRAESEQARAAA